MKTHMMTGLRNLETYLVRVIKALNILLNVLLGGHSHQTISARNHQRKRDGKLNLVFLIDLLFGKGHTLQSWIAWIERR